MPRGDKEEEKRAERVRAIADSQATDKQLQDDKTMHVSQD